MRPFSVKRGVHGRTTSGGTAGKNHSPQTRSIPSADERRLFRFKSAFHLDHPPGYVFLFRTVGRPYADNDNRTIEEADADSC